MKIGNTDFLEKLFTPGAVKQSSPLPPSPPPTHLQNCQPSTTVHFPSTTSNKTCLHAKQNFPDIIILNSPLAYIAQHNCHDKSLSEAPTP